MNKVSTEKIKWYSQVEPEVFPCFICKKQKAKLRSTLKDEFVFIHICHCIECGNMTANEMMLILDK